MQSCIGLRTLENLISGKKHDLDGDSVIEIGSDVTPPQEISDSDATYIPEGIDSDADTVPVKVPAIGGTDDFDDTIEIEVENLPPRMQGRIHF